MGGHEPDILWPVLDLFELGCVDKMFAECYGYRSNPRHALFFEHQIGPRMQLLNPQDLPKCKTRYINLKYQRLQSDRDLKGCLVPPSVTTVYHIEDGEEVEVWGGIMESVVFSNDHMRLFSLVLMLIVMALGWKQCQRFCH